MKISGIPFLLNTNKLLERLLDRGINSNPEDLQEEGILPKGSIPYWQSNDESIRKILLEKLHKEPTFVFKQLRDVIFKYLALKFEIFFKPDIHFLHGKN